MKYTEIPYEKKVLSYLNEMKMKRKSCLECSYFSNGENKYVWYSKESHKLREEYENQADISEERMAEIMEFAKIEKYKQEVLTKPHLTFLQKASEYRDKVLELKREVSAKDRLFFSNGHVMTNWLYINNQKAMDDLASDKELTPERIHEIDVLGEINFLVNEVFPKKKKLSFEEKAAEYRDKLYSIGRNIKEDDEFYFSNGEKMNYDWIDKQIISHRSLHRRTGYINSSRVSVLFDLVDCRERLDDEVYESYIPKEKKLK